MNAKTRFGPAAILIVALFAGSPAFAGDRTCASPWVAQLSGTTVDFDDRVADRQTGSGVRIGIGRRNCLAMSGHSHWELNFSANRIDGAPIDANDQLGVTLDRLRLYRIGAWTPFWQTGVGTVREYGRDGTGAWYPALQLGGGVLFELAERGAALRADILFQGVWNDDAIAGEPFHHDTRFSLGLMLPLRFD